MVADSSSLAAEIRARLGPSPRLSEWPLISAVVLNRDGAGMLRRLLNGLCERTDYPHLELIVVDNGSSDGSLDFLRRVNVPFPLSIVANPHNESFSDACNQGAESASGELLLFLNNDVEPFEPSWLRELVACRRLRDAGAAATTLICLDEEHERRFRYGYGVQHRGLGFREVDGMLAPALCGWEADPLDGELGVDRERGAVAAACVLVERAAFREVGGFTQGYVYGAEDIDLCLKLRAAGRAVFCAGRSIAIHHPVSTRRAAPFEEERARKFANRRLLWERWGPQLRREYELALLDGSDMWTPHLPSASGGRRGESSPGRAELDSLGFCVKAADRTAAVRPEALCASLRERGRRCLALSGDRVDDPIGLNEDVAVHFSGQARYLPKPAQLNVLLDAGRSGVPAEVERSHYDLVLSDDEDPGRLAGHLLSALGASASDLGYRCRIGP